MRFSASYFHLKVFSWFFCPRPGCNDNSCHTIFLESCSFFPIPLKFLALSILVGYVAKDLIILRTGMIGLELTSFWDKLIFGMC